MAEKASGMQDNAIHMEHVPLDLLHDHPQNDYPNDEQAMEDLMDSIRREGLAQLPLVRKVDGGYQIVAGHRRVECYRRLSAEDPRYATMPVSVMDGCDDERAMVLLDVTNLMTRQLSTVERAKRYERLWNVVPQLRREDATLKGVRTSQIIADIITRETGQAVSRATVDRALMAGRRAQEVKDSLAEYDDVLIEPWRKEFAVREGFAPDLVREVASRDASVQEQIWDEYTHGEMTPKQLARALSRETAKTDADIEHALDSVIRTLREVSSWKRQYGAAVDLYRVDYIRGQLDKLTRDR